MNDDAERGLPNQRISETPGDEPGRAMESDYAREALRVAGVTLFVQDTDHRFVWVQGQARGAEPAAWVGRVDEDLLPSTVAARSRAEKNLSLSTGETRHWTHEVETDGEFRTVQSRFAPLKGPNGDIVGIIGAVLDITEERRIEDALRVSEQLLRRVLDSLYAFVAVLDTEGRLLEVNRAPLEASNLSRETVIGHFFWEAGWWTSSDEQGRLKQAVRRAAAGETVRHDLDIHVHGADDATMDFQIAPLRDSRGEVVLLVCSGVDVTARKRAERDLQQALLRTEIALRAGQTGVWELELDSRRRTWDARMRELWGFGPDDALEEADVRGVVLPPDRHKLTEAVHLATLAGGTGELDVEFRIAPRGGGGERWIAVRGQLYRQPGRPARMIGTARDITDVKDHDAHIHFLMREVVHRSKNLLAVIQAMARQTAATGGTAREFEERFTARLQALAGSHDLLVRDDWRGASARELVRSQLGHYADLIGSRISVEGPDVVLKPEAAQNIGLALHELSTNAAKYGALANEDGRIEISWMVDSGGEGARFSLAWTERGGPPVEPPTREGFGHRVMKRIAAHALEGDVSLQFPAEGLEWRLSIPATYIIGRERKGPMDPREMAAGAIRGG